MAGKYTREQISDLVVNVLRGLHHRNDITEESRYDVDLIVEDKVKELYYYALVIHLQKLGCVLVDFNPEDCSKAESVRDIVDAVWNDVKGDL